ncbi:MAG: M42 family metallopeptidase [Candidatus Bipolaricaulis sp.]|nr:M42 family metallopeptidase [Candidatus Bipolaricaulis sp.]MDD5646508.1 M42 family metallopeptidase [Candidatus Bipolaricaulis sp.]
MQKDRLKFLKTYMDTVCPTGYEEDASRVWRKEADRFADRTWVDVHGNTLAAINEKAPFRVMLAGHADEIGLLISYADDKGYLSFTGLGGWDLAILPGQRVRIRTQNGIVLGVIGRKPIHVMKDEDRKALPKIEDLWIDIGAKTKAEALKLVTIGDPAVLDYDAQELRNGLFVGRGIDDRIGAFVVLDALRRLAERKVKVGVYAVATVQEEIGSRGAQTSAFGIDPHVGIAVDVGFATDCPGMDDAKKKWGEVAMGGGPIITRGPNINAPLFRLLVGTAEAKKIPHQFDTCPRGTGTDANTIQLVRGGVATAVLGIPNRYMHSPCELVHLDDVEHTIELIAQTVATMKATTNLIPG